MRFSRDKRINELVKNLIKSGWLHQRGKSHGKLISPFGKKIAVPCTPSDHRAYENFKHDIQRISLNQYT